MVEANIRVHRWILISRVRDVDAAEARFFVNALSGLFLISTCLLLQRKGCRKMCVNALDGLISFLQ